MGILYLIVGAIMGHIYTKIETLTDILGDRLRLRRQNGGVNTSRA